jgi:predicted nicotinamide N-methyase
MQEKLVANLRQTVSQASLSITRLPHCGSLQLHLLDPDYPKGELPYEEMMAILETPAYWAFCWASGHAFARFILQNQHHFRGKSVLDFGSGSGVVGIAAAKAGATKVFACDIDPMALDAIEANARLNQVEIFTCECINEVEQRPDLIIAADVLYDRDNHHFLEAFQSMSDCVLLADSRMKRLDVEGYRVIAELESRTLPDLQEFEEFNQVKIYHYDSLD